MDFIYDNSGRPFALKYSTDGGGSFATYYYVLNLQGDVVALLDANCNVVARYTYNAWGKLLSVTDNTGTAITGTYSIAHLNPLRYRGYYYDTETEFYYLQSRYYDPVLRRFISADCYTDTSTGFLGYNMFAYCNDSPINGKDPCGTCYHSSDLMVNCHMCQGRPPEDNYDYVYAPEGNHTVTICWSVGHDSRANVSVTATYYSPEYINDLYEQERYDAYHTNSSGQILLGSVASYSIGSYLGRVIEAPYVGLFLFGMELFLEVCYETNRAARANTLGEIAGINWWNGSFRMQCIYV